MAGHQYNLKFWGVHQIPEKDIQAHQYYDKGTDDGGEYYNAKKCFVESRGELWKPRNKRPEKLRDNLNFLEDHLKSNKVIFMRWKTPSVVQLIFNSGLLTDISISNTYDISKIIFDKSATGEVVSPSSAIYADHFVCFSFENQSSLAYSTLKPDIKLTFVNMPGPKSHMKRNLCLNSSEDLLACWWQFGPWIQTAKEDDRKNVVLFTSSYSRLDVLCSLKSENDITHLEFSKYHNQLLTLEKSYNTRKECYIDFVTYDCNKEQMQRLHVVSFPLKSGVLSCARNENEDKVLIGCSDGSINLYDLTIQQLVGSVSRNTILPTLSMWLGGVIVVASGQGELLTMDSNLHPLSLYGMEEKAFPKLEFSQYLTSGNGLMQMTSNGQSTLLLLFNGGPLTVFRILGKLTITEILKQHVDNNNISEAVNLLCSINWNYKGDQAFQGLMIIVDYILKQPLNFDYETKMEAAFSSFYLSTRPIADALVLKYRNTISCYVRRFFHHLMRYQRFEKAFLLAKDINSVDLFMDIYFRAKDVGSIKIAKLAKQKADEIIAVESSDSSSFPDDSQFDGQDLEPGDLQEVLDVLDKNVENMMDASESTSTLKVTNLGYV